MDLWTPWTASWPAAGSALAAIVFLIVRAVRTWRRLQQSGLLQAGRDASEANRLARNQDALDRARGGDRSGLEYLLARAGDSEPCQLEGHGYVSAWATVTARNDALLKALEARRWIERAEGRKPA